MYDFTVDILPTLSVTITPSGAATVGEIYNLACSVSVTGSTDQPTITWLDPIDNQIMPTTGSINTLTFNPLAASDTGTYTCRATLGNIEMTESIEVIIEGASQ